MSLDTAMERLRAANPAPDIRLIRDKPEDLAVLLTTTWQRSTNMDTNQPQGTRSSQPNTRRGWVAAVAAFAVVLVVGAVAIVNSTQSDSFAAPGPVTIEGAVDSSTRPVVGTFNVTVGADILECSSGTFVDEYIAQDDIRRAMTCDTGANTGTFTLSFALTGPDSGPGDENGSWRVVEGTGDFSGLQGAGNWSVIWSETDPDEGADTFTGEMGFTPQNDA